MNDNFIDALEALYYNALVKKEIEQLNYYKNYNMPSAAMLREISYKMESINVTDEERKKLLVQAFYPTFKEAKKLLEYLQKRGVYERAQNDPKERFKVLSKCC